MVLTDNQDWLLGHEPVGRRINVRNELGRIKKNPLDPLIKQLGEPRIAMVSDDFTAYRRAYSNYYLSYSRFLPAMSIAARYSKGPYWVRKVGGKYSASERKIAKRYREIAPYLDYDFTNLIIHTRILLDRAIAFSRFFLKGSMLPSFTSFNDHKKFLRKCSIEGYTEYRDYICDQTDWFEVPLKLVRDKFIVHASPKHMRFMGYPNGEWELDMNILLPAGSSERPFEKTRIVRFNAVRLSQEVEEFLEWFGGYASKHLNK